VVLVDSVLPHLSNVDVLPLKRKELYEYILVSPVSTFRLSRSLTCILRVYILLSYLSLIGNSPSCTSSEFTSCQALKLKKTKNLCSAYSPPSSRPLSSFHTCIARKFLFYNQLIILGNTGIATRLAVHPYLALRSFYEATFTVD
jgi:hypothetical protein